MHLQQKNGIFEMSALTGLLVEPDCLNLLFETVMISASMIFFRFWNILQMGELLKPY